MLTASNISSIAISSTIRFFRFRKMPTTLIANNSAPTPRYQDSDTTTFPLCLSAFCLPCSIFRRHRDQPDAIAAPYLGLLRRVLPLRVLAPTQRQRNGGDNRHQQDDTCDLQRKNIFGKREHSERPSVIGVCDTGARARHSLPLRLGQDEPHLQHDQRCNPETPRRIAPEA